MISRSQPESSSKRRGIGKPVLFSVLALLLAAGGVLVWYFVLRTPALPKDLKLVSADSLGFYSVRVADLWESESVKDLRDKMKSSDFDPSEAIKSWEDKLGMSISDIERVTFVMPDEDVFDPKEGPPAFWAIVLAKKPFDKEKLKKAFELEKREHDGKEYFAPQIADLKEAAVHFVDDKIAVVSHEKGLHAFFAQKIKREGPLEKPLQRAAENHHLAFAFAMPSKIRKQMKAAAKENKELEEYLPILDIETVTFLTDFGKNTEIEIVADYSSDDKAKEAEKALDKGRKVVKKLMTDQLGALPKAVQKPVNKLFDSIKIERDDASVTVSAKVDDFNVLTGLTLPAVQKVREAAARSKSQNNLKQIGVANHDCAGDFRDQLPDDIRDKNGKALLSWRVRILPYIEQNNLYKQFKLDEPWDSEHNKKLIAQMPKTYELPYGAPALEGMTHYQRFVGEGTIFRKTGPLTFTQITSQDGMTNTILVAEAATAVPWTAPMDIAYSPQVDPRSQVGQPGMPVFNVGIADGSVRSLPLTISEKTFRIAITPDDGQVLGPDW